MHDHLHGGDGPAPWPGPGFEFTSFTFLRSLADCDCEPYFFSDLPFFYVQVNVYCSEWLKYQCHGQFHI